MTNAKTTSNPLMPFFSVLASPFGDGCAIWHNKSDRVPNIKESGVLHLMFRCGMNSLRNESAVRELYLRATMLAIVDPMTAQCDISFGDMLDCIGFRTDINSLPRPAFLSGLARRAEGMAITVVDFEDTAQRWKPLRQVAEDARLFPEQGQP